MLCRTRAAADLKPLKCLTSDLTQTYSLCNPQFRYETSDNPRRVLTKPSKPVHNDGADNEDYDYILYVNDVLGGEQGGDR
jgi:dual specificity protein kinase YAK1